MPSSWERLTSVTLDDANSEIETPTFTPKAFLRVVFNGVNQSAASNIEFQVGTGGTGTWDIDYGSGVGNNTHYTWRASDDNDTDATDNGDSKIRLGIPSASNEYSYGEIAIKNLSAEYKMFITDTLTVIAGAGTAPNRREVVGKWENTTGQINIMRVFLTQGGSEFDEGSTITVWGADASAAFYPYYSNGAIFEESDTGKHYMFDGTDTWNEIT